MLSPFRRRRLVAAALVFLPAAAAAQSRTPGLTDEDRPEVVGLKITGVHSVDADQLRSAISTDASHCRSLAYRFTVCPFYKGDAVYQRAYFDPVEFRRDVLRIKVFYYERGYRETQVDTVVARVGRPGSNRVQVAFNVTEGPPTVVDTVIVQRAGGALPQRRRRRLSRLRKGAPLNLLRLDSTVVAVRNALGDRGYADAEVGTRVSADTVTRRAAVTITVDPKRRVTVDSVVVAGNRRVSTETIRNSLLLKEGDIYRASDVQESRRTLYESGLFRRADVTITPPTDTTRPQTDSTKTLYVTVQEAPPHAVRTSVGFNTFEFFQVGGATRTTTCSAARGGSTCRARWGTSARGSSTSGSSSRTSS